MLFRTSTHNAHVVIYVVSTRASTDGAACELLFIICDRTVLYGRCRLRAIATARAFIWMAPLASYCWFFSYRTDIYGWHRLRAVIYYLFPYLAYTCTVREFLYGDFVSLSHCCRLGVPPVLDRLIIYSRDVGERPYQFWMVLPGVCVCVSIPDSDGATKLGASSCPILGGTARSL